MDGIQRFFKFEPISASCCVGNDDIFTIMLHWIILRLRGAGRMLYNIGKFCG